MENLTTLLAKGVVDKELFAVKRLRGEQDEEAELALHFDLTVPLARYVAQHFNELVFPFRRYQLQKVWRGERPQRGRAREFYQFDIDTIALDTLPLACDAEIVSVTWKAFDSLKLGAFTLKLNNRKALQGALQSLGLSGATLKSAVTAIDKIDKIGPRGVAAELGEKGIAEAVQEQILQLATNKYPACDGVAKLRALRIDNDLFNQGVDEIEELLALMVPDALASIVVDLSLARGLEYYTGVIFETILNAAPEYGSIASGGRYDDLASEFINKRLPGVGVSIGLTRVMELLVEKKIDLPRTRRPAVLVTVYNEAQRGACNELAEKIRSQQIICEVYFRSPKLGKQIEYAEAKGIPFVAFLNADTHELNVKDLHTKEQRKIDDLTRWCAMLNENFQGGQDRTPRS